MKRTITWVVGGLALMLLLLILRNNTDVISPATGFDDFGFWSIVPAALTLVLCFWTKEVISALFIGIAAGGIVSGKFNIIAEFLLPAVGTESYAQILLVYLWCLGGLIGLWTRTGGARYFANWAGKRMVRGRKSARLFGCLIGTVFHQGGTISTILAGSTVKPVADEAGVSHEELSYIIDSTASPIATVIPFNVWPAYVGGLVVGTIPLFATIGDATSFFYKAIFFNFYGILAVVFTYTFALDLNPFVFGKMKRAIERVKTTGELDAPGSPDHVQQGVGAAEGSRGLQDDQLGLLGPNSHPHRDCRGRSDRQLSGHGNREGSHQRGFCALRSFRHDPGLIKGMKLPEVIEGFVDGVKGVSLGAIILALAVTLGTVSGSLGTAGIPGPDHQRDHPTGSPSGHLHAHLYVGGFFGGIILGHLRGSVSHRHAAGLCGEPGSLLHHPRVLGLSWVGPCTATSARPSAIPRSSRAWPRDRTTWTT